MTTPSTRVEAGPAGPAPGTPVHVTIAVPTYRRPDRLRALLPLLLDQAREVTRMSRGRCAVDVLVIDNDPTGSAAAVVVELAEPRLRYVGEPAPGIAAVRNRALDEADDASMLAFIDDDERPEQEWLVQLLRTWRDTHAAAVVGRVRVEYDGDLDPWLRSGDFFARRSLPTGTRLGVAATSNLLLDLVQVRALGVRFASGLGLGGGEDNLFTRSLARAGGELVWCDESVVVDLLPDERATRRWVLTRAMSHGNAAVLTDLRLTGASGARPALRLRWAVRGLIRIGAGGARWCWGRLRRSDRHTARGLRAVHRGAGMLGGACGLVFREYTRSGRRWAWASGAV
jgi:succinoglycan biosynthesis protein ExoM